VTELAANDAGRTIPAHGISLGEATRVWLRVAALSFGGPAGQIAVMHRIVVDEKKWISESRFLYLLSYCMLLPGPEAHQLKIYMGWLLHRWPGAIIAGGLFVLPGVVSIMALSWIYALYGQVPIVAALFFGLKAAVLAIVLYAVYRVGSRALKSGAMMALAAFAFVAIFFSHVPFPLIVLAAGVIGFVGARAGSAAFIVGEGHGGGNAHAVQDSALGDEMPEHVRPTVGRALRVSAIWLVLWLGPVIAIIATLGAAHTFSEIGLFFSKMAVVTFGGAYAVLAYMAQQAVETYGWLRPGEMLDGLGMAETTPGPLIMVVQFVGFMAAYRDPGALPPLLAGTLGGLLATWTTFVPCFLWIGLGAPFIERLRDHKPLSGALPPLLAGTLGGLLATWTTFVPCFLWIGLGAPFIERLRNHKPLSGALAGITAAVVGVILNLAIWFALHSWFRDTLPVGGYGIGFDMPVLASLNPWALILSLAAMVAIFRFKAGTIQTLAACSAAGILLYVAGLATP